MRPRLETIAVCAIETPRFSTIVSSRGVRRRRIFPVCSTCWDKQREDDSFLYDALCDLTRPAVQVIRAVLPGGEQGDGRPKGVLRLVRTDKPDHEP